MNNLVSSKILADAKGKGFKPISGTTDIECPECEGNGCPNKVTYSIHLGYAIDGHSCPKCGNTGVIKYPWKVSVVLENGELPKDELAELVLRQTEAIGFEEAPHPYYKSQQDMVDAGYVQEVRQVVE